MTTTVTNKFQEITKQFQSLTIWRPNERDPLVELDCWRTDAHLTIEQLYNRKRQQIKQLAEQHEREFLRHVTRQRLALNNIRKKLSTKKDTNTHARAYNENSILHELQKVERDINVSLGRGEIIVESMPVNCDDLVTVRLKTYLSATPTPYFKEVSPRNQSQKPLRRSVDKVQRAYDGWLQVKRDEEATIRNELLSSRQRAESAHEERLSRRVKREGAHERWVPTKQAQGAFNKKKMAITNDCIEQGTAEI